MKKELKNRIREKLRKRLLMLPDFVADYLYVLENSKEIQTRFEYAKDIHLFLEFLILSEKCTKTNVKDITPADLDALTERDLIDFFDYISSHTKTYRSTANKQVVQEFTNSEVGKSRKLATLHKLFSYLFKKGMVSKDVTQNIEIKIHKKAKIKQRLTPEEIQRLFETIIEDVNVENRHQKRYHEKVKFRDYIIVLLLAYTGIRISELVQLDISDIQLHKKVMIVTRKGGDQQAITIPNRIIEDIASYLEYRKGIQGVSSKDQDALFLSLQKKRINTKTVRNMLEKYRVRSGIETKITPHVFRRTFGTNHYNMYEDMYLTAQTLGHSSAETTRKFYAEPDSERVIRSMEQFDYGQQKNSPLELDTEKLSKLAEKLGMDVNELLKELV